MKSVKKIITSFFLVGIFLFSTETNAQQDVQARQCIGNFIEGVTKGNQVKFNMSLQKNATFKFVDAKTNEFKSQVLTFDLLKRKVTNPEGFKVNLMGVDVSGTTAQAKVTYDYVDRKLVDYFNLLKIKGEWKIVDVICATEIIK
ncbi:MAG: nuclear transport factor 2 family protein [Arcicella sp.]|jgi:polyisoprenoid-binding protein YceI|nr:nuclear transport factor 2 family protein [Arcicella sp.]